LNFTIKLREWQETFEDSASTQTTKVPAVLFNKIWKLMTAKNSFWEKWLDCGSKLLTQGKKLVHSLWEKYMICAAHKLLNQLFIYQGTILDFMKRHWTCGALKGRQQILFAIIVLAFKCVWLLWKPVIFSVYTQIKTEFMNPNIVIGKNWIKMEDQLLRDCRYHDSVSLCNCLYSVQTLMCL